VRALWCGVVFAGCLSSLAVSAPAQQVVHALTGTVSSIDDLSKTLIVFQDNGSEGQFKDMTSAKTHMVIDKKVTLESASPDSFKKKGAYVIVFYCGDNEDRTAVALKNLGAGPFTSVEGTVVKYEGKQHSISLQDTSGAMQTFKIAPDTVAEGYMGVVDGLKFQAQKGDHIRVVGTSDSSGSTALFVRAM
jgi:autotransporter adhesin